MPVISPPERITVPVTVTVLATIPKVPAELVKLPPTALVPVKSVLISCKVLAPEWVILLKVELAPGSKL